MNPRAILFYLRYLRTYQREMQISIAPSLCPETSSLVVVETMVWRKTIIATRIGVLPETIVHGNTGLLVKLNNPHALAQSIQGLLEQPFLADRLGGISYQHNLAHPTPDHIAPRVHDVYRNTLQKAEYRIQTQ